MLTAKAAMSCRPEWVLGLAGFCLILLQFFMLREVTALLKGTELVILLVTLAYFIGYSLGYGVAGRLSNDALRLIALLTWVLHLTIPFSFRYIGGFLASLATSGLALYGLLFLTAFALSSFYSILLPRFIDQAADDTQAPSMSSGAEQESDRVWSPPLLPPLVRLYGAELLGAVAGVLALLATASIPWLPSILYQAALALLVALLWSRSLIWLATGAGVAGYALIYPTAQQDSLNYSYAKARGFTGHQVVYSVNTLYQKVDVVREANGRRKLYLSGRMNYGTNNLTRLNVGLSLLPAKLLRPREALIVGSGSMESVRHAAEFSGQVTTCELDAAVVTGSRQWLSDINRLDDINNWSLVIADAKEFLGRTNKRFDLIVMDVPAPTTIQLGLLHSVDFYRLAQQRLSKNGMISVSLCGTFAPDKRAPLTVAAALLKVFPTVLIFTAKEARRSFALAGETLPFSLEEFRAVGATLGFSTIHIFNALEIKDIVADTEPMTADNMWHVVRDSWSHLHDMMVEGVR